MALLATAGMGDGPADADPSRGRSDGAGHARLGRPGPLCAARNVSCSPARRRPRPSRWPRPPPRRPRRHRHPRRPPSRSPSRRRPRWRSSRVPGADIVCPVAGGVDFVDSWGAARSGGRSHQGTDMMAGYGTPTVAPVSGTVEQHSSSAGGLAWYVHGDDGNTYYGAHLSSYENEGAGWVEAGTVIGYVGDSGNAAGTPASALRVPPGRRLRRQPVLAGGGGLLTRPPRGGRRVGSPPAGRPRLSPCASASSVERGPRARLSPPAWPRWATTCVVGLPVEVPGDGGGRQPARPVARPPPHHRRGRQRQAAADADVVVIATPWDGATQTAVSVERPAAGQGRHLDGQRADQARQGVPAAGPAPGLGGRQRAGRGARAAWWPPPSTTCRPRSWATSTSRSRATC